jgi:hypothetical protein
MSIRALVAGCAVATLLLACRGGEEPAPAEPKSAAPKVGLGGIYLVHGTTVEQETGQSREISGQVLLTAKGDAYTSTFNLETLFPTKEGPIHADVIGKGSGTIEGASLSGTAETQLVMAAVPGVDEDFAFIPRVLGPRIRSKASGHLEPDGTLVIEIESEGIEGERYAPTRTTLRGRPIPAEELAAGRVEVGEE